MNKNLLPLVLAVGLLTACGDQSAAPPSSSEVPAVVQEAASSTDVADMAVANADWVPEAAAVAQQLGGALKGKLQAAMKAGGPTAAIAVCHEEAPLLAQQVSAATGFSVTRVSAKPRNPEMGVPNDWQQEVLDEFADRQAAGEGAEQMAWSAEVDGEQRFMKAIPTGGVCLTCHGTDLQPEVATALAELYPADQATGYSVGDIRGAFVVTRATP